MVPCMHSACCHKPCRKTSEDHAKAKQLVSQAKSRRQAMHSSIKRCCTFCQQTLGRCRSFLAREAATATTQSGLAVPGLCVEKQTQAWTLCQRKFASKMFKNILHQHCTPALFAASHHPAVNLANMHPAGTVTSTSNRTIQHPKKAPAPVPKTASAPAAPQKKTAVLEQHPPKKNTFCQKMRPGHQSITCTSNSTRAPGTGTGTPNRMPLSTLPSILQKCAHSVTNNLHQLQTCIHPSTSPSMLPKMQPAPPPPQCARAVVPKQATYAWRRVRGVDGQWNSFGYTLGVPPLPACRYHAYKVRRYLTLCGSPGCPAVSQALWRAVFSAAGPFCSTIAGGRRNG